MNNQALIIRDNSALSCSFTSAALALKEAALDASALIGAVETADDQTVAVAAQRELRAVIKQAEDARKACKEPILEFGKRIDHAAKLFKAELETEELRLARLVGDFQQAEIAKQKAAEAARRLEAERLERERQQAEFEARRKAQEEQARLDAEARKAAEEARKARNQEEADRAAAVQLEIERQRQLAEAANLQAMEKIQEQHAAQVQDLPIYQPSRAEGQIVKEEWVIDQIREFELMKARPDLVRRVEFDTLAIKAALNGGQRLPGVAAHKEVKVTTRAAFATKAIEV